MANWGNTDDAANSVLWATTQAKLTPNTDNQSNLFGNTTADAFITGKTLGQFGVSRAEAQALRAGANTKVAHAGWVLRNVGSGDRAGRVMNETLVAMKTISTDTSDDAVLPDYKINITTQPSSASGNSTANEVVTFTVAAASVPTGAAFVYKWQVWGGSSFGNINDGAVYAGTTAASLLVNANTSPTLNGKIYRVQVSNASSGAANAVSSNAVITITT